MTKMEMQDAPRVAVIMGSKGEAGAANAALLAAAIVALGDPALRERLKAYRARETASVLEETL